MKTSGLLRSLNIIVLLYVCLCGSSEVRAGSPGLEFAGPYFGLGASTHTRDFTQAGIIADVGLPWTWQPCKDIFLSTRVELLTGWLGEKGFNAMVGGAGPGLMLSSPRCPVFFEAAVCASGITRSDFASRDLGAEIQFVSRLGLSFNVVERIAVGYSLQHMSNAGLGTHNPGLNMHVLAIRYRF